MEDPQPTAHVRDLRNVAERDARRPVVAAAVILPPGLSIDGVADSKTLTARDREALDAVCHLPRPGAYLQRGAKRD